MSGKDSSKTSSSTVHKSGGMSSNLSEGDGTDSKDSKESKGSSSEVASMASPRSKDKGKIRFLVVGEEESKFRINLAEHDTVAVLRVEVARNAGMKIEQILLFFPTKLSEELSDDLSIPALVQRASSMGITSPQNDHIPVHLVKDRSYKEKDPSSAIRLRLWDPFQHDPQSPLMIISDFEKDKMKRRSTSSRAASESRRKSETTGGRGSVKSAAAAVAVAMASGGQTMPTNQGPTSPRSSTSVSQTPSAKMSTAKKPLGDGNILNQVLFLFPSGGDTIHSLKSRLCDKMWNSGDHRDWRYDLIRLRLNVTKTNELLKKQGKEEISKSKFDKYEMKRDTAKEAKELADADAKVRASNEAELARRKADPDAEVDKTGSPTMPIQEAEKDDDKEDKHNSKGDKEDEKAEVEKEKEKEKEKESEAEAEKPKEDPPDECHGTEQVVDTTAANSPSPLPPLSVDVNASSSTPSPPTPVPDTVVEFVDNVPLSTLGICRDYVFTLVLLPHAIGHSFELVINDIQNRNYKLLVHDLLPVKHVKEKFFHLNKNRKQWEGVKGDWIRFRTIAKGEKMKDEEKSLRDYGVIQGKRGAQITFKLKPPNSSGGKCEVM